MAATESPAIETSSSPEPRDPADRSASTPADAAQPPQITRAAPWRRLSHEPGTALHAILGHAELLLEGSFGPLGGEARACVSEIQGAGRQLALELRRLLLIVEACSSPLQEREAVDLRDLFETAFADRPVWLRWHGGPLVVQGERCWLRTMADAIADLVTIDAPRGSALVAAWDDDGRSLQLSSTAGRPASGEWDAVGQALIEVIARRHGAEAYWLPASRLQLRDLNMSG